MLLLFLDYLQHAYSLRFPSLEYYSTRMLLAAATSLLLCILLGPSFISLLSWLKCKQQVRTEDCPLLGQLHGKKGNTPTMGGVLILAALFLSLLLYANLKSVFTLILFLVTALLGILGIVDDYLKIRKENSKGISARAKMGVQVVVSLVLAGYLLFFQGVPSSEKGSWFPAPVIKEQVVVKVAQDPRWGEQVQNVLVIKQLSLRDLALRLYLPFKRSPLLLFSGFLGFVWAALLIVGVIAGFSNAVNLTDGLDGLAAGCLILVATALAFLAFFSNHVDMAAHLHITYIQESGEIGIYLVALAGATLGFLWYNGYPAQMIMGDTGSLALGGGIGASAILLGRPLLLTLVGGIFVVETISVILQVASFKLFRRRIFLCAPLHHHFEYLGWPENRVVVRFWIVGLLLALVGIVSLKMQ